jgi:glycosyltransferase involved in cell wall biosynthesis
VSSPPAGVAPLRVAVEAQLFPDCGAGGIEGVVIGLIRALGRLDGPEQYVVIGPPVGHEWLLSHAGSNTAVVPAPPREKSPRPSAYSLKSMLGPLRPMARILWRSAFPVTPPASNGWYETLGCHVLHFPYQTYARTTIPCVFNPHDLQHRHYPQYFDGPEIARRERLYRTACREAQAVAVASQWVKTDIVRQYAIDPKRIQVIPWAPPTAMHDAPSDGAVAEVRRKLDLDEQFALYPAMTWPHKNHRRLLEAMAVLRDRGVELNLVCTGALHQAWPGIREQLSALRLEDRVRFVGMLPAAELRAVYRLASFVVVPTLFEASSLPVFESWEAGAAVTCSTVTSLPEQAGDAALLFDPTKVDAIADAVGRMAADPALREDLRRRGARRLAYFSWDRTARAYRALYRRAAGRQLSDDDAGLLAWDWMRKPLGPQLSSTLAATACSS